MLCLLKVCIVIVYHFEQLKMALYIEYIEQSVSYHRRNNCSYCHGDHSFWREHYLHNSSVFLFNRFSEDFLIQIKWEIFHKIAFIFTV